ncbi:hypothetical protein JA33_218 [Dickeya phage vB_DsoM_JA33]|uniref:Uncharacterized protein n=3 Tax=Salmondvirus JA11 TaxID=2734141 RepID=A0A386K5X2_9CAUD|nr:hypothetical protein HOU32_gp217 [Dickeya phage vB_DsoM_JA11]AXG66621.1 putative cyclic phosphodiesterase [Dickeya phage vB_DsoM_JA13]AXG67592.1 hypothetical protein JA33_218 [Dickeya phage vB_DsoM_JA33]AYD80022.1 hypothetical protein JA11_217 [Dickeya phage vB_DsoM_JA11]
MDTNKLHSLGMYDFVKNHASKYGRWCNFIDRSSVVMPFELLRDRKVIHYKWRQNVPEIFIHPVVDIIFSALPEQNIENFGKEASALFEWLRLNIKDHGFHFRSFVFNNEEGERVGIVYRIFANEDFPCYIHPEYITHAEGRAPCPACYTAVTFGEFHPLEIKPVDSRLMEKTK